MSKRDWGTGFAVGLVAGIGVAFLFLAWSVPEFRDPNYYQRAEQSEAQQSNDKPSEEQSEHYWIDALHGYVFTEDSLAQWIMAAFGIAATFISLLALYWLKGTWDQAKRSADAARDTLAAERAWITPDRVDFEFHPKLRLNDESVGEAISFIFVWRNTGRSPAVDLSAGVLNASVKPGYLLPVFEIKRSDKSIPVAILGQDTEYRTLAQLLYGSDLDAFKARTHDFIVYSNVEYRDVFKRSEQRHTEATFRCRYQGQTEKEGKLFPKIAYMADGPQNSVK